ncbi:MAG: cyclodeaminase/cyclohydrolase family protein [Thermomicrobiales bacterium]
MIDDFSGRTVGDYLEALASAEPAPGGGSAVALAGALAAALAEMVCRLSIGRADAADADEELRAALHAATEARRRLLRLSAEDAAAYAAYVAATGLPKVTPEEKAARRSTVVAALRTAADVPSEIAAACFRVLETLTPIARLGSIHVLSDVEVAAFLANAAIRGAIVNVRVNARLMRDRETAMSYLDRATEMEARVQFAADGVLDLVRQRSGST